VLAFYFANYFVIVFFNSALVACAMIRFRGGNPTLGAGMRAARERLPQIAAWALLAASVGVILKMIENRVQFVGRIVTALLVRPGPSVAISSCRCWWWTRSGRSMRSSAPISILKKAWGESIVGNLGLGLITSLVTIGLLTLTGFATAFLALNIGSMAVALTGVVLMVLIIVLAALVGSALNAIVLSAPLPLRHRGQGARGLRRRATAAGVRGEVAGRRAAWMY